MPLGPGHWHCSSIITYWHKDYLASTFWLLSLYSWDSTGTTRWILSNSSGQTEKRLRKKWQDEGVSKIRWKKGRGRENFEVNKEKKDEKTGSVIVFLLFPSSSSCFPKDNPVATHPPLPSYLVPKEDRSICLVSAIRMNFALLSVHCFITGTVYNCTAESAASQRESKLRAELQPLSGRAWAGGSHLGVTSGAILLQDAVQLNFNTQLNGCVAFSSQLHLSSCGNLLFLWIQKEKPHLKAFAFTVEKHNMTDKEMNFHG